MWQKKSSRSVFKTQWLELIEDQVEDPAGDPKVYTYISTKAGVSIIALDDQKRIYFVKQYRYPTQTWSWELPGGGAIDINPLLAAKNELHEELEMKAASWTLLKKLQSFPGTSDEWQHIYLAQELKPYKLNHLADDFPEDVIALEWGQIKDWINQGKINDSQTIASLFLYQQKLA